MYINIFIFACCSNKLLRFPLFMSGTVPFFPSFRFQFTTQAWFITDEKEVIAWNK